MSAFNRFTLPDVLMEWDETELQFYQCKKETE